jgi:Tol biopolymer transport system component
MRRTLLITSLAALAAATAAVPAQATFPGRNGPIAFRQFDPATEAFPLLRARPDGSRQTTLTDQPGAFSDWRADGRRLAFELFGPDGDVQIATMTPRGDDVRVLTKGTAIHEVPSWSPDGRRIVYGHSPLTDPEDPRFETRLWTMRADGRHQRPLPMDEPGFDNEPKYSPDGRTIVFVRLRKPTETTDWEAALFVVGAAGGRVRQLTPWGAYVEHPTWTPDGRLIAFNDPDGTIEVIRPDGRGRRTILPALDGRGGHKPWFSPNGRKILYMCENHGLLPEPPEDYNEDICVMDADGTDIVNLTHTPDRFENWPSWGPAPRKLRGPRHLMGRRPDSE